MHCVSEIRNVWRSKESPSRTKEEFDLSHFWFSFSNDRSHWHKKSPAPIDFPFFHNIDLQMIICKDYVYFQCSLAVWLTVIHPQYNHWTVLFMYSSPHIVHTQNTRDRVLSFWLTRSDFRQFTYVYLNTPSHSFLTPSENFLKWEPH